MPHYYLDSSVLVKCYVAETGSVWARQLVSDHNATLYSSDLAIAEVAAAIAILRRTGRINHRPQREAIAEFYKHTTTCFLHPPASRAIVRYAADLTQRHPPKGYDAVHLATALVLQRPLQDRRITLTFVSGDDSLLTAAQSEGLPIANPFDYAHLDQPEATQ